MATSLTHCFNFITTVLRGFHVYHNTVNWSPFDGQEVAFKCEFNDPYDKFAGCGKAILPGKIAPVVVGHVHDLFGSPYKKVRRYRQLCKEG